MLGWTACFTQNSDLHVNVIQKHPYTSAQNILLSLCIFVPHQSCDMIVAYCVTVIKLKMQQPRDNAHLLFHSVSGFWHGLAMFSSWDLTGLRKVPFWTVAHLRLDSGRSIVMNSFMLAEWKVSILAG